MARADRESTQPRSLDQIAGWDAEADVVVVGMGCAGVCAAIEAASAGAQVLALERASAGGGTSAASDGMMYLGGGTSLQKDCGYEDSPEEMFKYMVASCGPEPDEERIRAYCDGSVEHYNWLRAQGVPFKAEFYDQRMLPPEEQGLTYSGNELNYPYRDIARPAPRAHCPAVAGPTGGFLMEILLASAARAGVETRVDTWADTLVVDGKGRVVGLVAVSAGDEILVRARAGVVLATGGFVDNEEMVKRYAPMLMKCEGHVTVGADDGRSIRMGTAVGAAAVRMHTASVTLPFYPPKSLMKGIFVNRRGQRFMSEDCYQGTAGDTCLGYQEGRVFLVLDDETFARPGFREGMEVAAVGETIEELEAELGFPKGTLQSTMAIYNEYAARGEDPLFHKTREYLTPLVHPPFGAFDMSWDQTYYAAFTLGGLHTNANAEVLRPDGSAIPGLYAAGRSAASFCSPGYSSGMSVGEGTFYGRRAGRTAAAAR